VLRLQGHDAPTLAVNVFLLLLLLLLLLLVLLPRQCLLQRASCSSHVLLVDRVAAFAPAHRRLGRL
jgi:hypothetical protein